MAGLPGGTRIGGIEAPITIPLSKLKTDLGNAEQQFRASAAKIGQQLQTIGRNFTLFIGAPLAAAATAITVFGAKFEQSLTRSLAIMGNLSDQIRGEMSAAAIEVSRVVSFSAKEAAEAFFFLASAGLNAVESIGALPLVAQFAQAGTFELATATDLLTDAQSALGLTVDDTAQNMENMARVGDALVKANTLANASVQQFSQALTNKAATALRGVNKELEEGLAVLASWADQGVKARLAGERFNILLRQLPKVAIENAEAFKEFNIAVFDSEDRFRNLADIAEDLTDAFGELPAKQRAVKLAQLGITDELGAAINLMFGAADAIRRYQSDLDNAAGTMREVAQKQLQNLIDQFGLLKDRIIATGIELFQSFTPQLNDDVLPVFDRFVELIEGVGQGLTDLNPQIRNLGIGLGAILISTGPLIFAFGSLGKAIAFLGLGSLLLLSAKVTLAVAAISIVVLAGISDWNKYGEAITKAVKGFTDIPELRRLKEILGIDRFRDLLGIEGFKQGRGLEGFIILLREMGIGLPKARKGLRDISGAVSEAMGTMADDVAEGATRITSSLAEITKEMEDRAFALKESVRPEIVFAANVTEISNLASLLPSILNLDDVRIIFENLWEDFGDQGVASAELVRKEMGKLPDEISRIFEEARIEIINRQRFQEDLDNFERGILAFLDRLAAAQQFELENNPIANILAQAQGLSDMLAEFGDVISDEAIDFFSGRLFEQFEQIGVQAFARVIEELERINPILAEIFKQLRDRKATEDARKNITALVDTFGDLGGVLVQVGNLLENNFFVKIGKAIRILSGMVSGVRNVITSLRDLASRASSAFTTMRLQMEASLGVIGLILEGLTQMLSLFGVFDTEAPKPLTGLAKAIDELDQALERFGEQFTDVLVDFVREGKLQFKDLVDSILNDLLRITIQTSISDPIVNLIRGAFGKSAIDNATSATPFQGFGNIEGTVVSTKMSVQVIDQRQGGADIEIDETIGAGGERLIKLFIRDQIQEGIGSGQFDRVLRPLGGLRLGTARG